MSSDLKKVSPYNVVLPNVDKSHVVILDLGKFTSVMGLRTRVELFHLGREFGIHGGPVEVEIPRSHPYYNSGRKRGVGLT